MENWYSSSYFSVTSVWVSTSAQRLMAFNWKTETLATSRAAPEDCWVLCVPGGICRGGYRVCRSPSAELKVTFRLLLSPILPIKLCNRWKASGKSPSAFVSPFHRDNTRAHFSFQNSQKLVQLYWNIQVLIPYSLEPSPSDYYTFGHYRVYMKRE